MRALNVGLIGCGRIAELVYLDLLTRMSEVRLVAFAEANPERRSMVSDRIPNAIACTSYEELVKLPQVDAVVICLPNALHVEAAIAALQHQKHVYLEKPIATSTQDADRLLTVWRSSGRVGMVGFNYRFNPLYQSAKQAIQSQQLGELVVVRSVFASPSKQQTSWQLCRAQGGGALLELAVHHIDLVHYLFESNIESVFAQVRSMHGEQDTATLELQLSNGLLVQSLFSTSAIADDRFEIYGQRQKLTLDRYCSLAVNFTSAKQNYQGRSRLDFSGFSFTNRRSLWRKLVAPSNEPSYRSAIQQFVAAVQTQQPMQPDFYAGYRSLAVVEAAEQSAAIGKRILLQDQVYENLAH